MAELNGRRLTANNLRRLSQFLRSLSFTLSMNDFSPSFSLSFSLSRHGPLHRIGQLNVSDFYHAYLYSPRLCSFINQCLKLIIDSVAMSQQVFEVRLANEISQG